MIEINLIPDVKQELIKAQRLRTTVISGSIVASIIAGGVVALLVVYVFGVQTVRSSILDNQIKDGAAKLAEVEDLSKILTIQNQLSKISNISASKNMDSRVFDMLTTITPGGDNTVQFSQITIDNEEKIIRLEGQTRAYDSMEVLKKTVSSTVITYSLDGEVQTVNLASDISTSDISYGENADGARVLRFVLSFTYPDEMFSQTTTAPAFKLNVNGNVTDSSLGVPKSLFTERAKDL